MQEKAVTTAGHTYPLPKPFFVLATQNPIEQEGTYPLPEAQLDRFMFNIFVDYPSYAEEVEVVKTTTVESLSEPEQVINAEEILAFQDLVRKIPVADNVVEYAVNVASKSRPNTEMASAETNKYLSWGAGPRD
jgi:MoxR-like ATPase